MKPQRIQLSRRKGFKLQEASMALNGLPAVNVARPSDFGNPFPVSYGGAEAAVAAFREYCNPHSPLAEAARILLRGKNLACWCKPGSPCHADVLLEISCQEVTDG